MGTDSHPTDELAAAQAARHWPPTLSPEARDRIEKQVLARADQVFARQPAFTRVIRAARWAAAACLMVALLATILVVTSSGGPSDHAAQIVDQGQFSDPGALAPSSPDTSVYIPQHPVPLTEIGAGSTSLFIQPVAP